MKDLTPTKGAHGTDAHAAGSSSLLKDHRVGKNISNWEGKYSIRIIFLTTRQSQFGKLLIWGQFLCGKMHQNALGGTFNYAQQISFDL